MVETPATGRRQLARGAGGAVFVVGILLMALNLRPAAVALAPILADLRDRLQLSAVETALLPTLPVLCFGVFAPLAPPLRRWLGEERGLGVVALALLVGLGARALVPEVALLPGTVLACAGCAVGNVLVPSLLKRRAAEHAGIMTGVYTTTLAIGGGMATGLTVPAMEAAGGSLTAALGIWALLAVVGLVAWLPQLRHGRSEEAAAELAAGGRRGGLWRNRLAWQVTILAAVQSTLFYAIVGWLPTLLRAHGYSPARAGAVTTVLSLVGLVGSMLAPVVAARMRDQRAVLLAAFTLCALGLVGLLTRPTGAPGLVAVVLLGTGIAAMFTLVNLLFLLRAADSRTAALLSSMAQTVGYIAAATGPFAFGLLHESTGTWVVPLAMLLVMIMAEVPLALVVGRNRQIQA